MNKSMCFNETLSNDKGKEETNYDEGDETEFTDTKAFNVVVDVYDTTLQC